MVSISGWTTLNIISIHDVSLLCKTCDTNWYIYIKCSSFSLLYGFPLTDNMQMIEILLCHFIKVNYVANLKEPQFKMRIKVKCNYVISSQLNKGFNERLWEGTSYFSIFIYVFIHNVHSSAFGGIHILREGKILKYTLPVN